MDYYRKQKIKKFFIEIIVIILIVILVQIIMFFRKFGILIELKNNLEEYLLSNNYYIKEVVYDGEEVSTVEVYKKDDKIANISKRDNGELKYYSTGNMYIDYIDEDGNEKKTIIRQTHDSAFLTIINYFGDESIYDIMKTAYNAKIEKTICNGKECYKLINFQTPDMVNNGEEELGEIYVEKETGLVLRGTSLNSKIRIILEEEKKADTIINYYYDFNSVIGRDFKEPNVSDYEEYD